MATYAITAVRLNPSNDRVDLVKMGLVNTAKNEWASEPKEVPVIEAVNAIMRGDKVFTIFPESTETVLGPKLRTFAYPGGFEGIEVENPEENKGRTVRDLPKF
jgi:hypothetical protein